MKKTSIVYLIAAALYSWLFYEQCPGINFLIFTIAVLALSIINRKEIAGYTSWRFVAAGALISAICIAWHGNTLSFIANIISLALVSMMAVNKKSSVPVAMLNGAFMALASWVLIFLDRFYPTKWKKAELAPVPDEVPEDGPKKMPLTAKLIVFGVPLVVVMVFVAMYRASNPVFDYFASMINLDFISFSWVVFTFSGLLLLYAFFYNRELKTVSDYDINASGLVSVDKANRPSWLNNLLSAVHENTSGIVLFAALNVLLFMLNIIDINYTLLGQKLPKGINHSQVVHQGVNGLIWSIVLAVAIILYHFRGRLNFYKNNKALKALAYTWIAQNMFMVFSTGVRNYMYVSSNGMTAKRIGVYIYLGLCIIGLLSTCVKIMKRYTNWQLVRQVSWAFYGALLLCCFVNWEAYITDYNVEWERRHNQTVDGGYYISLNTKYLSQLMDLRNRSVANDTLPAHWTMIDNEIYRFLWQQNRTDWRSWNHDDDETAQSIENLKNTHKLDTLYLNGSNVEDFKPLLPLNLKSLSLEDERLDSFDNIGSLQSVNKLLIKRSVVTSFAGIEKMQNLNVLNFEVVTCTNVTPIARLKNLKKVYYKSGIDTAIADILKPLMPQTEFIAN